jgi:hypothetical protein
LVYQRLGYAGLLVISELTGGFEAACRPEDAHRDLDSLVNRVRRDSELASNLLRPEMPGHEAEAGLLPFAELI